MTDKQTHCDYVDVCKQVSAIIVTVCLFGFLFCYGIAVINNFFSPPTEPVAEVAPATLPAQLTERSDMETYTFDDLLDAIEWVESSGKPDPPMGKDGEVGTFQILPIYVDDVNRIMAFNEIMRPDYDVNLEPIRYAPFTYDYCRRDRQRSRAMVRIYLNHYGGTFEEMARKHNGGPNGHKKKSTEAYWLKVKARMDGAE